MTLCSVFDGCSGFKYRFYALLQALSVFLRLTRPVFSVFCE
ncbi:hypothetical protein HMPREF9346_04113 [Escherichia coli MS 119-7]|nr:hypothetical protein HMPREF9346_04113 [Escherichia coli MS 119-7]